MSTSCFCWVPPRSCRIAIFIFPCIALPPHFAPPSRRFPARFPTSSVDPALKDHWRQELAAIDGFKIGIVWQGSRAYGADRWRSIPLAQFAPLARVPGVRLVSLQKGFGAEQISTVDFPVLDLSGRLDEVAGPFMETAAVISNLDLVVAGNTAIAHLAEALGSTCLGCASLLTRLALAARSRRHAVVSKHAALPPNRLWPMAGSFRADCQFRYSSSTRKPRNSANPVCGRRRRKTQCRSRSRRACRSSTQSLSRLTVMDLGVLGGLFV